MKIEQQKWTKNKGWEVLSNNNLKDSVQLVFAFGGRDVIKDPVHLATLKTE